MKKYFFSAAVAIVALFATSCSQDETFAPEVTNQGATATFQVNLPTDDMTTRGADANVKRFAIAIEGVELGNGEGAFLIQDNGTFEIPGLVTGQQYTVYFWADYDAATLSTTKEDGMTADQYATYAVVWPNWVSLNDGKEMAMAYCGHTTITLGEQADPYAITLKRAVAQVTLTQKDAASATGAPWTKISFNRYTIYNAKTGECAGDAAEQKLSVDPAELTAGQQLHQFYVFAPEAGYTTDFAIKNGDDWTDGENVLHTNPIATISNVPLKANFKTNITGNFNTSTIAPARFIVTTDDTWATPDNTETF